ncbi:MAG TPA: helix-turn-helix domain-containing protein [Actinocatenispora sp.]
MTSDPAISAVAALDDPSRRGMYAYVRAARRPVTRDEAAAAVGISRKLAAFHLDKLVRAGLLRTTSGPAGDPPRVGRRPIAYQPTDAELTVSIPQRRHDMLAEILADAILAEDGTTPARDAVRDVAYERGRAAGADERDRARPGRLGAERALTYAARVLARHGFEPERPAPTCVRLRNCPFHPLAARSPELVCALTHAYVGGVLDGLDASAVRAVAAPPSPGDCCVQLHGT